MAVDNPTEDHEQSLLIEYLRVRNLPHFRVPSETYTKSWRQKAKNKRLGVVAGVPDVFVLVAGRMIAIEMKRRKGSTTSPEQKRWVALLNGHDVPARVCKGYDEAVAFIKEVEAA